MDCDIDISLSFLGMLLDDFGCVALVPSRDNNNSASDAGKSVFQHIVLSMSVAGPLPGRIVAESNALTNMVTRMPESALQCSSARNPRAAENVQHEAVANMAG
mmetsp:Transcript_2206/g.4460  ORF Transcript_2206/g.4460 Transcript_2206/m.4460 type:complete len:103 (-) Transcript_2206:327-635(-)